MSTPTKRKAPSTPTSASKKRTSPRSKVSYAADKENVPIAIEIPSSTEKDSKKEAKKRKSHRQSLGRRVSFSHTIDVRVFDKLADTLKPSPEEAVSTPGVRSPSAARRRNFVEYTEEMKSSSPVESVGASDEASVKPAAVALSAGQSTTSVTPLGKAAAAGAEPHAETPAYLKTPTIAGVMAFDKTQDFTVFTKQPLLRSIIAEHDNTDMDITRTVGGIVSAATAAEDGDVDMETDEEQQQAPQHRRVSIAAPTLSSLLDTTDDDDGPTFCSSSSAPASNEMDNVTMPNLAKLLSSVSDDTQNVTVSNLGKLLSAAHDDSMDLTQTTSIAKLLRSTEADGRDGTMDLGRLLRATQDDDTQAGTTSITRLLRSTETDGPAESTATLGNLLRSTEAEQQEGNTTSLTKLLRNTGDDTPDNSTTSLTKLLRSTADETREFRRMATSPAAGGDDTASMELTKMVGGLLRGEITLPSDDDLTGPSLGALLNRQSEGSEAADDSPVAPARRKKDKSRLSLGDLVMLEDDDYNVQQDSSADMDMSGVIPMAALLPPRMPTPQRSVPQSARPAPATPAVAVSAPAAAADLPAIATRAAFAAAPSPVVPALAAALAAPKPQTPAAAAPAATAAADAAKPASPERASAQASGTWPQPPSPAATPLSLRGSLLRNSLNTPIPPQNTLVNQLIRMNVMSVDATPGTPFFEQFKVRRSEEERPEAPSFEDTKDNGGEWRMPPRPPTDDDSPQQHTRTYIPDFPKTPAPDPEFSKMPFTLDDDHPDTFIGKIFSKPITYDAPVRPAGPEQAVTSSGPEAPMTLADLAAPAAAADSGAAAALESAAGQQAPPAATAASDGGKHKNGYSVDELIPWETASTASERASQIDVDHPAAAAAAALNASIPMLESGSVMSVTAVTAAAAAMPAEELGSITFDTFLQLIDQRPFKDQGSSDHRPSSAFCRDSLSRTEPVSLKEALYAVFVLKEEASLLEFGCEQLKQITASLSDAIAILEADVSQVNPPVFNAVRTAPDEERLQIMVQLKRLRARSKAEAKKTLQQWRVKIETNLNSRFNANGVEVLQEDLQKLIQHHDQMAELRQSLTTDTELFMQAHENTLIQARAPLVEPATASSVASVPAASVAAESELLATITKERELLSIESGLHSWRLKSLTADDAVFHFEQGLALAVKFGETRSDGKRLVEQKALTRLPGTTVDEFTESLVRAFEVGAVLEQLHSSGDLRAVLAELELRLVRVGKMRDEIKRLELPFTIRRQPPASAAELPAVKVEISSTRRRSKFFATFRLHDGLRRGALQDKVEFRSLFGSISEQEVRSALAAVGPGFDRLTRACVALNALA